MIALDGKIIRADLVLQFIKIIVHTLIPFKAGYNCLYTAYPLS